MGDVKRMGKSDKGENEIYVSDKRYHNDSMMAFFYELLSFFGEIRFVIHRTGSRHVSLLIGEDNYPVYNIGRETVSEYLVWIFFLFYNDRTTSKEIRIVSQEMQDIEIVSRSYWKNPNIKGFRIDSMTGSDQRKIEGLIEELETMFISPQVCKDLQRLFIELKSCYNHFDDFLIWNKTQISEFLDVYYDILSYFLCEDELLEVEGIVEKILIPVLNLGIIKTEPEVEDKAGMTMPVVLYAMSLVYDKLDEFLLLESNVYGELENLLYREIFLAKLHQMFRFYLIREKNEELCHAALPAFKRTMDFSAMGVPVRGITTYNSFQGIRELRLADKILFEVRQRFDLAKKGNEIDGEFIYHITILGDIVKEAMDVLLEYVRKQIILKNEYADMQEIDIRFKVYTLRPECEKSSACSKGVGGKYEYEFCQYHGQLLDAKDLKNILKEGDLFFFLDNCDLYRTEIENVDDIITFKQYISFGRHKNYHRRGLKDDLVLDSRFMDLYHILTMYAWKNEIGFLRKKAKEDLVKYIRNEIEGQKGKSAYIYISDINAFKGLACIQENIVRIETYNQKEIGIIRFTNYPRKELPVFFNSENIKSGQRKQILVFNMWQIVKHTVLNQKANFETVFLKKREKNMLDQIYIALDYSNWKKAMWVGYYYRDEKAYNQNEIEDFIAMVIQKIFSVGKKDMYQKYLKKVLISILYGAAKSVEDLLFVHILSEREDLLGQFFWWESNQRITLKPIRRSREKYNSIIESYYDLNCKYSLKKNYWEMMRKFDYTGLNILDQYIVFESIKKSSQVNGTIQQDGVVVRFLGEILKACESVGYKESVLYHNCLEIGKKDFGMI